MLADLTVLLFAALGLAVFVPELRKPAPSAWHRAARWLGVACAVVVALGVLGAMVA